jgi:fatty-acyl-CoA synthase
MQVSIQDAQGVPLPAGAEGEVCVCGPAVFAGYHNDPAANAAAFRDGWYRTGDLGMLDERGFLYLTGARVRHVHLGWLERSPREIEEQLLSHPAVQAAVVVGVPDPEWGESGRAVCVVSDDVTDIELLGWLRKRIAPYKVPKSVQFQPELPVLGNGKLDRARIRRMLT